MERRRSGPFRRSLQPLLALGEKTSSPPPPERGITRAMSRRALVSLIVTASLMGCAPLSKDADWPPLAKKWFDRASASFRVVDVADAERAIDNALRLEPDRAEVRLLAARVALSKLQYDRAVQTLEGLNGSEAQAIRGRAYWYGGDIAKAADALERLLSDPDVRDPWAQEVVKLARRGAGREPFRMTGGLLAVTEMPPVGAGALIVPLELNGEPALGLVATGTPEVMIDAGQGRDPSWVSLRFGERVEVKDVPALTKDLSGISRQLNAPIKLLLGVNLLRHLRPTIDYRGSQFVVRTYEPPPPPVSTTVKLAYIRGGGMVFRSSFRGDAEEGAASLLVDTSMQFPLALDDGGWKKAGVALADLRSIPNAGGLKQGLLPQLTLGAFSIPDVPGVHGASLAEFEKGLDVDLDGLVGAGLLAQFRLTLVDGGRTLWLEDTPRLEPAPASGSDDLQLDLPTVEGPPTEAGG